MKGICERLCPEQEVKLRVKENLLHFFELQNGQKGVPGIVVKEFARSAAGKKALRPCDLRTEKCLHETICHLLKHILLDKRKPYNIVYDFIFDRLRAVRQEMIIQEFDAGQTIRLLEPMIMFLAYSRYKLCEEAISNFDPKICDQHLQECLKRVLCCYDEVAVRELNLQELRSRCFIEAIYQLFNLGSTEALQRAIQLPLEIRESDNFVLAYNVIALSYHQGNLYRIMNGIKRLPHILGAIVAIKLPKLRRRLLLMFAHAYSSKQVLLPVDFVCALTLHCDKRHLLNECKHYGLQSVHNGDDDDVKDLKLIKTDFKIETALPLPLHEHFVDEKLKKIYLPEVLLLRKL